ncbi:DUF1223 domain-containing protein [Aestuariirhabdus litorea]|uniref:DUF1223 domain-containing protein n=1 Tax=Aestuariirhabdus litorea TaxID=2528527 RepID=UPI001A9E5C34|nr:DUF1223 domain-containing protein [Aestuariirhabdus litorea]
MARSSILLLLMLSLPSWGWQINSGSRHTPLLELYTSQGCSSCPPADRRFSSLKHHPQLWQGLQWRLPLPDPIAPQGVPLAISAWVGRGDRLQPLQAVGGWWTP